MANRKPSGLNPQAPVFPAHGARHVSQARLSTHTVYLDGFEDLFPGRADFTAVSIHVMCYATAGHLNPSLPQLSSSLSTRWQQRLAELDASKRENQPSTWVPPHLRYKTNKSTAPTTAQSSDQTTNAAEVYAPETRLYEYPHAANDLQTKPSTWVPPHLRYKTNKSTAVTTSQSCDQVSITAEVFTLPHIRDTALSGNSLHSGEASEHGHTNDDRRDSLVPCISGETVRSEDPFITKDLDNAKNARLNAFTSKLVVGITPPISPKCKELSIPLPKAIEIIDIPQIESLSLTPKQWQPDYITSLPALPSIKTEIIPDFADMGSFSPDFLHDKFGGITWSPGMHFIPPPTVTPIVNRVYYCVDVQYDPFLPETPGKHGAKMVPFFNANPEDDDQFKLPAGFSSLNKFPLFVLREVPVKPGSSVLRKRYFYYGHYTQSRWSDRLDYERMRTCVSQHVREFWAEELSSGGRPQWITDALQQHFFPIPKLEDVFPSIYGQIGDDDFPEEKLAKDLQKHIKCYESWKKETDMKTRMVKKSSIMEAFDRADADNPPGLRLWWEYLECVDWRPDFYNSLVSLQSREPMYA